MKFSVTPELAILLKTVRTQNGISAKDLAAAIHKSPSYISKLESGDVKHIKEEILTDIFSFITEGDDFYEECLPAVVKTLNSFIAPEKVLDQLWLLQYDIVERPVPVPPEMMKDLSERIEGLGMTSREVADFLNLNVDSEMSGEFPGNTIISLPYEEGNRLLVRLQQPPEDIEALLSGEKRMSNHLVLNGLVFTVMRLLEYGRTPVKMPPDIAVKVLSATSTFMGQYNVHSLTGYSHMLSSEEFTKRQEVMAWPFSSEDNSTLNEALEFFREAMDHDALNTKKALDAFLDALSWDPAFMMKVMSLPFQDLEGLSFQNKKKLLEELSAVVEKYNSMSDFEKRLETY